MFDYLQQFNRLPKDLRDKVSSASVMTAISELEAKYKADLAATVMKVMIKSIPIKELALHLAAESGLSSDKAEELARELRDRVFNSVGDYLGLAAEQRALDLEKDIEVIIREAGLVIPSAVLVSRFKTILSTYLRGVRSKIDTRNTFAKDVKIGGLNLSPEEIDRVFKICTAHKFSNLVTGQSGQLSQPHINREVLAAGPGGQEVVKKADVPILPKVPPRLAEIMTKADRADAYDLRKSIADTKAKLETDPAKMKGNLDPGHEISAPKAQLDLPAPDQTLKLAGAWPKTANVPVKPQLPSREAEPKPELAPKPVVPTPAVAPIAKSEQVQKTSNQEIKPVQVKPEQPKPAVSVSELLKKTITPAKPIDPKPAPAKVPEKAPLPAGPAANRPAPTASPRPQMHDIKPMPKVMGPIEELQFLDVVNFRRLGATPAESVNKIYAKIKLLEKDGYDKMVAGVKAWRQSPTNRLYLRLGQESVAKGILFNDVLAERKKAGQDHLSAEEVQAIIALNGKLVF